MSGLDKMKSRIFEEAEQSAAELLDQAKKDAEKIVKDAVEKAGGGCRTYPCKSCG